MPLRPNVCMLVFNAEKRIFLGERLGEPGHWQFPQGGVEDDCSLKENVIREIQEELGIKRKHIGDIIQLSATHEYDWENVPVHALGKWRGQSQTFWAVQFIGEDRNIKIDGEQAEFMNWQWCDKKKVLSLAEPKRLVGYRPALDELETLLKKY